MPKTTRPGRDAKPGKLVWYEEPRKTPGGWPVNPALDEVLHSRQWVMILRGLANEAKALFAQRARRRTGRYAGAGHTNIGYLRTIKSDPSRLAGIMSVRVRYAAAVEFGKANTAASLRGAAGRANRRGLADVRAGRAHRRVLANSMPQRYLGDHTLGGDNRRVRSVVADMERRYGGRRR